MEGGESLPISNVVKKSPQELAAQVQSVYGTSFEFHVGKDYKFMDEKYKSIKESVGGLLDQGLSNEDLETKLNQYYEEAKAESLVLPLEGARAAEFIQSEKERLLKYGFDDEEAEKDARKNVARAGYVEALRRWRIQQEKYVSENFSETLKKYNLEPEEERRRMEELRGKCIFLNETTPEGLLAREFSGGNYLFHATEVKQAIRILESGDLVSAKELNEREEQRAAETGEKKGLVKNNSGYEGISWNFNQVSALPGDRYHLVGFLGSANELLRDDLQLTVPSRPAADELIMINGEIDSNKYYEYKVQLELLEDFSAFGDKNAVLSNIVTLSMFNEQGRKIDENSILDNSSQINKFCMSDLGDEQMADLLRSKYKLKENGRIEFSVDLLQQIKDEIPVGAVWLQALIDSGRMKDIPGFESVTKVREAEPMINKSNKKEFFRQMKIDKMLLENEFGNEDEKVNGVSVSTSEMYIVVPDRDLDKWLKVLARTDTKLKGILVYDRKKVRLENFASKHVGDHRNLSQILRQAIPVTEGYIDYEDDILGDKITMDKMGGYRHQVIAERHINNRRSIRKDSNGDLVVV